MTLSLYIIDYHTKYSYDLCSIIYWNIILVAFMTLWQYNKTNVFKLLLSKMLTQTCLGQMSMISFGKQGNLSRLFIDLYQMVSSRFWWEIIYLLLDLHFWKSPLHNNISTLKMVEILHTIRVENKRQHSKIRNNLLTTISILQVHNNDIVLLKSIVCRTSYKNIYNKQSMYRFRTTEIYKYWCFRMWRSPY